MSAFIVEDIHIDAIVTFMDDTQESLYAGGIIFKATLIDDLQRVGQILMDENYRSVNARYQTKTPAPVYRYRQTPAFKPVVILALLACYQYQACETEDYYQSTAHEIVSLLKDRAAACLAGYNEVPWALDESYRVIQYNSPKAALLDRWR